MSPAIPSTLSGVEEKTQDLRPRVLQVQPTRQLTRGLGHTISVGCKPTERLLNPTPSWMRYSPLAIPAPQILFTAYNWHSNHFPSILAAFCLLRGHRPCSGHPPYTSPPSTLPTTSWLMARHPRTRPRATRWPGTDV